MIPNREIYTLLILCLGIILAVWLVSRSTEKINQLNTETKSGLAPIEIAETANQYTNDDWKKLLVKLEPKDESVTSVVKSDDKVFDDTTVTANLTRDVMSQYLSLKGGGKEVSTEDLNSIVEKTLTNPTYTKVEGAKYLTSNLKIDNENNPATVKNYKLLMADYIRKGFAQVKDDPYVIIINSTKSKKESDIAKLDPIIKVNKTVINQMLNITVPREAVSFHLNLLNSLSNTLADLESIRVLFSDPVRSLAGINSFDEHRTSLVASINAISLYLAKK